MKLFLAIALSLFLPVGVHAACTETPNLGLDKCALGDPSWHLNLNANFDALDFNFVSPLTLEADNDVVLGTVPASKGGTGFATYTLGDTLYASGASLAVLPGNTTATKKFMCQTGTGTVSAAPQWCTAIAADGALTDVTANQGLLKTSSTVGLIDCAAGQVLTRNTGDTAWECGSGGSLILDLGDNDVNESTSLAEIAVTGDINGVFAEPTANKLLIAAGNDWPKADNADDLSCTNCIGGTEIDEATLDDDVLPFDDADSNWTATALGPALEELDDVINAGSPNAATGKVDWSQLVSVPAGFADGTDDGAGGGSGDSVSVNGTAATDANFVDGDIDWTLDTGATPDAVTATVGCTGCVDATDLAADSVTEAKLKAVDAAVDEECLTFETTTGDFEWQTCGSGGGGTPGGSDTQLQYNNSGAFGGTAGITFKSAHNGLEITGGTLGAYPAAFLAVTGNLLSGGLSYGSRFSFASSGAGGSEQVATQFSLTGASTTASRTAAFKADNTAQGTGSTLYFDTEDVPIVNITGSAWTLGSTSLGINIGYSGLATASTNRNIGVYGRANDDVSGSNIGVLGAASRSPEGVDLANVGVLGTTDTTLPAAAAVTAGVMAAAPAAGRPFTAYIDDTEVARIDGTTTAGQTRFLIWDVDNGTLERVTVGAADSCGTGFKCLRIPN